MSLLHSSFRKQIMIVSCAFFLLFSGNIFAQVTEIQITTNSENARNIFIQGRDMMENLQVVKASELFDTAITLDPNFALAHIYRALTGVGGFNVVRTNIDEALKNVENVTNGERDLVLLNVTFIDGNQLKQKVYLDRLLTNFPKDKRVQTWAGIYYYTTKDFKTSKTHLDNSIKLDTKFAPAYNLLGYVEFELNNTVKAENALQTYASLIPDSPNPNDSYGEILLKMGKYDESINQYTMALTKDPNFASSIIGIGNNNIFKNNFTEARKWYQKCFDGTTDISTKLEALTWTATSYIHEGNINMAINTLNNRIDLAKDNNLIPDMINTYNSECLILTEAGKVNEGIQMLETATKLLETSTLPEETRQTLMLRTNLNRCYSLISNNQLDDAQQKITSLSQTINSRDNISEIQQLNSNLAMLSLKRGDLSKAISHFAKSDVTSELNQYYMGVTYDKMGNKAKANEYFTKVKNSRNNNIGLAVVKARTIE